jgi:hypothetical protein
LINLIICSLLGEHGGFFWPIDVVDAQEHTFSQRYFRTCRKPSFEDIFSHQEMMVHKVAS